MRILILLITMISFTCLWASDKEKRYPSKLDCKMKLSAMFANGGNDIIGSVSNFRCGKKTIALKQKGVVKNHIQTRDFGDILLGVPNLMSPRVVLYMTKSQEAKIKKYITE